MEDTLIAQRREKAAGLRARGDNPYANDFQVTHLAGDLHAEHDGKSAEDLDAAAIAVAIAGRVRGVRKFGKLVFMAIDDRAGGFRPISSKRKWSPNKSSAPALSIWGTSWGSKAPSW